MATLKDHQQAMVDLLASGSGIPASSSRLAHAMHDVLGVLVNGCVDNTQHVQMLLDDATTPGLNDKVLAADVEALRVDSPAKWPVTRAERRVKELENTVRQLRASNAKLKSQYSSCFKALEEATTDCQNMQYQLDRLRGEPEQAGCRKDDTQVCDPDFVGSVDDDFLTCRKCGGVAP